MKILKDVLVGKTVTVSRLHGEGPLKRRVMDMGMSNIISCLSGKKKVLTTRQNLC